jgi:hypothetical protein
MQAVFVPLVCLGLLLCGLAHLLFPDATDREMSRSGNVRLAGATLLALVIPAIVLRFYVLAILFAIFGLPRLCAPHRSIALQRIYSRRTHGVLLMMGAAGLWVAFKLVHR